MRLVIFALFLHLVTSYIPFNMAGYIPLSSQVRNIIPHKVQLTHLDLQDYDTIQLDLWT